MHPSARDVPRRVGVGVWGWGCGVLWLHAVLVLFPFRVLDCSEAPAAVLELEEYGLPFSRDKNNKIYQVCYLLHPIPSPAPRTVPATANGERCSLWLPRGGAPPPPVRSAVLVTRGSGLCPCCRTAVLCVCWLLVCSVPLVGSLWTSARAVRRTAARALPTARATRCCTPCRCCVYAAAVACSLRGLPLACPARVPVHWLSPWVPPPRCVFSFTGCVHVRAAVAFA
jgi:hypothetical protein